MMYENLCHDSTFTGSISKCTGKITGSETNKARGKCIAAYLGPLWPPQHFYLQATHELQMSAPGFSHAGSGIIAGKNARPTAADIDLLPTDHFPDKYPLRIKAPFP
ncbi:hypothetical protein ACRALDRAFT_213265 [Sodiomyces alcalophilus JCM 7366]|uniref:uncharacterized protein n=1 Tax=Sodiomyces alcalophilus JCM 7366 TaxID=591952 RepID=UPI0039B37731